MWEAIAQATVIMIILTGFFMLNLRAWAFYKKGLDPVKAVKKTELSAAKSLVLEQQKQDIMNLG